MVLVGGVQLGSNGIIIANLKYLASWTVCNVQTLSVLSVNKITALYFQLAIPSPTHRKIFTSYHVTYRITKLLIVQFSPSLCYKKNGTNMMYLTNEILNEN